MTIGHNSGTNVAALPESMQDIAEALGVRIVFALVEHFGGVSVRVPKNLKRGHRLMKIGEQEAFALSQYCPGEILEVPITLDKGALKRQVVTLQGKGRTYGEIARELGITQRHVRRLANKPDRRDKRQMDLFPDNT